MRWRPAALAVAGAAALLSVWAFPSARFLIWNKTESAPRGLYLIVSGAIEKGDFVVVSGASTAAKWIAAHGYLGKGWPLIKRVAAVAGDEICRHGRAVSIDGIFAAKALASDSRGRELPRWEGCFTLRADEFFLLNDHPRSLDGRYFGATKREEILGKARLLMRTG